jgi:hypothetical protein
VRVSREGKGKSIDVEVGGGWGGVGARVAELGCAVGYSIGGGPWALRSHRRRGPARGRRGEERG